MLPRQNLNMKIGLKFSQTGWVVKQVNPAANYQFNDPGDAENRKIFGGRRPILVNPRHREIMVGLPGWYHGELANEYGTSEWEHTRGFFGGGPMWGNGRLSWYDDEEPHIHRDVAQSLVDSGFDIPNMEPDESDYEPNLEHADWAEDLD